MYVHTRFPFRYSTGRCWGGEGKLEQDRKANGKGTHKERGAPGNGRRSLMRDGVTVYFCCLYLIANYKFWCLNYSHASTSACSLSTLVCVCLPFLALGGREVCVAPLRDNGRVWMAPSTDYWPPKHGQNGARPHQHGSQQPASSVALGLNTRNERAAKRGRLCSRWHVTEQDGASQHSTHSLIFHVIVGHIAWAI